MNISHVGIDHKFAAPHERKQLEIYRATEITNWFTTKQLIICTLIGNGAGI